MLPGLHNHGPGMGLSQVLSICLSVVQFGVLVRLNSGSVSDSFCLHLELFSSYWVALSSPDMTVWAQSYYSLLGHVQWIPLGGVLFFFYIGKGKVDLGERGWKEGVERNYGQDVIYERRTKVFFFLNKKDVLKKKWVIIPINNYFSETG